MIHGMVEGDSGWGEEPDWLEQGDDQEDNVSLNRELDDIRDLRNVPMVDIGVMLRMGALVVLCCIEEEAHQHLRNHLPGEEGPHKLVVLEAQRVAGSWEELAVVVGPVVEEPVYCYLEDNCK